ncbi:CHAT domain-containing protein [Arthrobacter sp. CJ23]|uniref:CHAT domain-containing protein n=1 Tax=Arthrobacter sp. CJ23 TaxID=2972479 RepID=UPI0028526CBE|nr:CHAT domain-containing protein [Arthrobacter sp. CJ23]
MDADIELEIDSGSEHGEYTVRVVEAPAGGHASGTFTLDVAGILERRAELEATVLASSVAARRTTPVMELPVRGVGQELFQALFTREVYGTYRASLGAAQHAGQQLRVVLRLAAPELAALPWEMLFDPETESYLCQTEPLLRHIPAPDYHLNPLDITPPLRILGIVASPRDLPSLNVDAEKDHLTQALAGPVSEGRIELVWAAGGTWDAVQAALLAGPWHVVHFIGHGDYDARADEGRIALEGPDGRAAMVRAVRLMALLSIAAPRPRLVVLNSCSSGETGQADLFSGTAASLVRSGISAVAAMQFAISDSAAIAFAHGFYAAIANGRAVDEAARVGRISVMASPDGTLEWVTPALYVRGGSTQLFTLAAPAKPPTAANAAAVPAPFAAPVPPAAAPGLFAAPVPVPGTLSDADALRLKERAHKAQLRALYVQATAELRTRNFGPAAELFDDVLALEPGYRDAQALRDSALRQLELAEQYGHAREAEAAQDWGGAAEIYALLEGEAGYPDAGERRKDCERRQRVAELQSELRYHAQRGSWQAVLDVAVELEALDPAEADPDGLTTAARTELRGTPAAPAAEEPAPAAPAAEEPAPAAPAVEEPPAAVAVPEAPLAKPVPQRPAALPEAAAPRAPATPVPVPPSPAPPSAPVRRPVPAPWESWLGLAGGLLLAVAGIVGAGAVTEYYWYVYKMDSGATSLALALGLLIPAALLAMAAAGVPTRAVAGRLLLAAAALSSTVLGWAGLERMSVPTAAFLTVLQGTAALALGILCVREPWPRRVAGWILGLSLTAVALAWIREEPLFFQLSYFVPLTLAGLVVAWVSRPWQAPDPGGGEHPLPQAHSGAGLAPASTLASPRPVNPRLLLSGGLVLAASGTWAAWGQGVILVDEGWWWEGGREILRLLLGLAVPLGYILVLAGLPGRPVRGKVLLGVAIAAVALHGGSVDVEVDPDYVPLRVALSLVASACAVAALMIARRSQPELQPAQWLLAAPLVLQPIIWIPSSGAFVVVHLVLVAAAGTALAVLARRAAARPAGPR